MIVPTHASAVTVVATSDLVGTVPASLAERASGGPQRLQAFDLPFDTERHCHRSGLAPAP
jgi:hypothetical protein